MLDRKDTAILAQAGIYAVLACAACLFIAVVLGISIHILRALGGI